MYWYRVDVIGVQMELELMFINKIKMYMTKILFLKIHKIFTYRRNVKLGIN